MERYFYRMKPVLLEAVQLDGHNVNDVLRFCGLDNIIEIMWGSVSNDYTRIKIKFFDEVHTAEIGDWLVQGTNGEIYIFKDKTFNSYFQFDKTMHML